MWSDMDVVLAAAGFLVGVVVGLTGMGGGALMTPVLVLFFGIPPLAAVSSDLVVSAVMKPVGGAAGGLGGVAHLLFGDFRFDLTVTVLAGALPGVFIGAQMSSRLPGGLVRRALTLVLVVSGGKLLGMSDLALVVTVGMLVLVGPFVWIWARRSHGLPALARHESAR